MSKAMRLDRGMTGSAAEAEAPRAVTEERCAAGLHRVAGVLSLCVPGTGHVHRGWVNEGIAWLVIAAVGYTTAPALGFVVHTLCVCHAATAD
jgi:hypothetical protein